MTTTTMTDAWPTKTRTPGDAARPPRTAADLRTAAPAVLAAGGLAAAYLTPGGAATAWDPVASAAILSSAAAFLATVETRDLAWLTVAAILGSALT